MVLGQSPGPWVSIQIILFQQIYLLQCTAHLPCLHLLDQFVRDLGTGGGEGPLDPAGGVPRVPGKEQIGANNAVGQGYMGGISQDVNRLKMWHFYSLIFGFS